MNSALAAVAPNPQSFAEAQTPVVFVDSAPAPALSLLRFEAALPMDDRHASLTYDANTFEIEQVVGRVLTLATPHPLSDGEVRWRVLLSGVVSRHAFERAEGLDNNAFIVRDALSQVLAEDATVLGGWVQASQTLGQVLSRLALLVQAECVFACDPTVLQRRVDTPLPESRSIGAMLSPRLEDAGLVLRQTLSMHQGVVKRTLFVLPGRAGRYVHLPLPDAQGVGGWLRSVEIDRASRPPRNWVALGARPMVEDTFMLQHGWDPGLEGQPDADYGRLTSSDFSRLGEVYRSWVLNEDGGYSAAPLHLDRFDLAALFESGTPIDSALRFGDCLTQNPSGRSLSPVIESSTDSGATWSAYPGSATVMNDRAGVLLDDDVLPAPILAAAKAGTLALRVTASLTAPDPMQARRWDGNPFAGAGPTRVIRDVGRYHWRRVMPTSIHAPGIAAGALTADTADDRRALRSALLERIAQSPGGEASATVELTGAWSVFEPADRVREISEGQRIDAMPAGFDGRDARVRNVVIDFGITGRSPRTWLQLD